MRAWAAGAGLLAAGVFLAAYLTTSDLAEEDGAQPRLASITQTRTPTIPVAEIAPSTPVPRDAAPDAPIDSQPAQRSAAATPTERGVEGPPANEPTDATLPRFDAEALIFGGSGATGAVLAGVGIVPAVGNRTPWSLVIPAAQLRAGIVGVGVTPGGALGAPDNPEVIGWWEAGPSPGEPGNVLLTGHRDFRDIYGNVGAGVCWLLPNVVPGDFILIEDDEARVTHLYVVSAAVSVSYDDPAASTYLRGDSGSAKLTLITCDGVFNAETVNYSERRVVVAGLTDTVPRS